MGGDEHGRSPVGKTPDDPAVVQHPPGVEVCRGLVEDDDGGFVDEGPGETEALPHPFRVAADLRPDAVQPDEGEEVVDPPFPLGLAEPVEPRRVVEVLFCGAVGVEPDVFGHVANLLLHLDWVGGDLGPVDGARARGRLDEPDEHQDGGALAGAVRAEQPEDLAGGDLEAEVVHGSDAVVDLGQVVAADHRRSSVSSPSSKQKTSSMVTPKVFAIL